MPVSLHGVTGTVVESDGTSFRALRTTNRPAEYGSLGHYQVATVTGTLAAALAAGAVLFSFRWGDATRLCRVSEITASFQALTLHTAATLVDFGFDAYFARAFTASHTGGTGLTLTGNSFKTRTSMGTTLVTDIRVSTTAGLAAGTLTADANAFANSIGDPQRVNVAAGTEEQRVNDPTLIWKAKESDGDHPLLLAQNEGFLVRNRTVWPAAGTGIVRVQVKWSEHVADAWD